jgi:hypothetical protein
VSLGVIIVLLLFENVLHEFLHILLAVYKGGDVNSYFELLSNYVELTEETKIESFLANSSALEEKVVNELVKVVQSALKEGNLGGDWNDVIRIAFNTLNGKPITDPVDVENQALSIKKPTAIKIKPIKILKGLQKFLILSNIFILILY